MNKAIGTRILAAASAMLCCSMLVTGTAGTHIGNAVTARIEAAAAEDTAALAEFLNSGYDKANCTIYDGTSKEKGFNMNGRTYYQGVTFGSYYNNYITFNVADYSTLSFTLGHLDNSNSKDTAAIEINLDGAWSQTIDVNKQMVCTEYTIDVSEATTLQISVPASNWYGFGDISLDGTTTENVHATPVYSSSELFTQGAYDTTNCTVYSGIDRSASFNMAGRTFYQGVTFGSYYENAASFNVENASSISFTLGHLDNKSSDEECAITIYKDGVWSESIDVNKQMLCTEYTLDVADASTLRIVVPEDNYYGFGDITVDGTAPIHPQAAPTFTTSESFLKDYYNEYYFTCYDGSNGTNYFNMAGRSYYQGFTLGKYYDSYVTYNVENLSSITFTLGHLDNAGGDDACAIQLYLDGVWYENIDVSKQMLCTEYTIDVTDASTLRIVVPEDNYYGFGDVTVNEIAPIKAHNVPAYTTSEAMLAAAYDSSYFTSYDGSTGLSYFNMAGRSYYQGFTLGKYYDSYVTFNVENVSSVSFTLGHLDNMGGDETGALQIYLDGVWVENIDVNKHMLCTEYFIDVSAASTLRILAPEDNYYGFGDVSVNELGVKKTVSIPEYTISEKFVTAAYDTYNFTSYDGTTATTAFNMNGRTYYQGFTLGSYNDSYATFNVENLSTVTFTLAHWDDKGTLVGGTIQVYMDGVLAQNIDVQKDMLCTEYTLDVSEVSTLRFVVPGYNYYGFGDISVNELGCVRAHTTPTYASGGEFVAAAYDVSNFKLYDGTTGTNSFSMMGVTFTQGITSPTLYGCSAYFNVENVETIAFTLGHLDDADTYGGTLVIEKDGEVYRQIELTPTMLNTEYTMNVSEASTLRFYLDSYEYYGIANIMLNGDASEFKGTAYTDPDAIIDLDAVPEFSLGDVNLDGVVDATDASYILIAAAAVGSGGTSGLTEDAETNADVNLDGAFDATDAAYVLQYAAAAGTGYTGAPEAFFAPFQTA